MFAALKKPLSRAAAGRRTEFWGQGGQGGFNFGFVIGMVGQRTGHNQQTGLIHGGLGIVGLFEAGVVSILHDARFGIGEVVLVSVAAGRLSAAPAHVRRVYVP